MSSMEAGDDEDGSSSSPPLPLSATRRLYLQRLLETLQEHERIEFAARWRKQFVAPKEAEDLNLENIINAERLFATEEEKRAPSSSSSTSSKDLIEKGEIASMIYQSIVSMRNDGNDSSNNNDICRETKTIKRQRPTITEELMKEKKQKQQQQQQQQQQHIEPFYCSVCNETVRTQSPEAHSHSTLHMINASAEETPKKHYYLPEANRGYQMLKEKLGWVEEKGLGAQNQGPLDPVKSLLKRDMLGLGHPRSSNNKPKVTHFAPNDVSAIQHPRDNNKRKNSSNSNNSSSNNSNNNSGEKKKAKRRSRGKVRRETEYLKKREEKKDKAIREALYRDPYPLGIS